MTDPRLILLWIILIGLVLAAVIDAARFSRDEYVAAFGRPRKLDFVAGPILFLPCGGAGIGLALLYFVWARRRLVRARDGEVLGTPALERATTKVLVGSWDRALNSVDRQLRQARS